jgi:hypothetical protein
MLRLFLETTDVQRIIGTEFSFGQTRLSWRRFEDPRAKRQRADEECMWMAPAPAAKGIIDLGRQAFGASREEIPKNPLSRVPR